ncbi:hypothetical protein, partial [Nonomuraea sp. SBT364]|uniref:hypothetical protein n=1 Tax=Nonomuraea sp. SBT364 TaxID=1580530 RepID=UPI000B102DAA
MSDSGEKQADQPKWWERVGEPMIAAVVGTVVGLLLQPLINSYDTLPPWVSLVAVGAIALFFLAISLIKVIPIFVRRHSRAATGILVMLTGLWAGFWIGLLYH